MALRIILFLAFLVSGRVVLGQAETASDGLPAVFLIGEHEDSYLALARAFPAVFVSIYQEDLDAAYQAWSRILLDLEDYAGRLDFDLKGVKLWFNLYAHPDGRIAHIAFYPKPNSRLVPEEQLTALFRQFARDYRLPVSWDKGFQHSASASFPVHYIRAGQETVRKD